MKHVTAYKVTNLSRVDTTRFKQGDIFYTNRSIGILHNKTIKTLGRTVNLNEYVKRSEVEKMVKNAINNKY